MASIDRDTGNFQIRAQIQARNQSRHNGMDDKAK